MSQQDYWQAHPSYSGMAGKQHSENLGANDLPTFVNPLHDGSSQHYFPYTFSSETVIPPPPPGVVSPRGTPSKSNRGYQIALAILALFVVVLGSLEVIQLVVHTPLVTNPSGSTRSSQAGIIPTRYATAPVRTLTAGTIKERVRLTCSGCDDPVLTTLTSITIDTSNQRVIFSMTLQNVSGAQQIDYFAEFSLQDPLGNTYKGTGALNSDFFLDAGQIAMKNEIFSFLPSAGVSYTLETRLGIAGITYDPLQLTF
jgi:hypothetical protein